MANRRRIHLFGEDLGHERFLTALLVRLSEEESVKIQIVAGSVQGGQGRALAELRTHQKAILSTGGAPDLLVVAIDANCKGWSGARQEILENIDQTAFPAFALAVPDPHVERWYLADPPSLKRSLEVAVTPGRRKCDRDEYKRHLISALRMAGHPVTLGGAEFAEEIVGEMDLFRAGKNEPSLKHFLEEIRGVMRSWKQSGGVDEEQGSESRDS